MDGLLLGPGPLAKAVTKPYASDYLWQTGEYCTHDGKIYKFVAEDLIAGETWNPSHWSEVKLTDEIINLQNQIDVLDPESAVGLFSDVPFTINSNQWTLTGITYTYNYSNALIKSSSGVVVYYDDSFKTALSGDIKMTKNTGYVTFATTDTPQGALSGTLRIIDSVSGTLPVTRGGTGSVTAKGARQNLNVSIKPIPVDFGTVTSLPQTVYDADITAEMTAMKWEIDNPAACPKGITMTVAAGSVTISLDSSQTFSGESTIKVWLVNPRTVADNGTGQNQEQYTGDYVQIGAQSLSGAQQTQVKTNIGIVYSETTAPSNPVEGMIWLKKKV